MSRRHENGGDVLELTTIILYVVLSGKLMMLKSITVRRIAVPQGYSTVKIFYK